MSKQVTLGEQFQKQTFEALALQVPGGHFLIFKKHYPILSLLFQLLRLPPLTQLLGMTCWMWMKSLKSSRTVTKMTTASYPQVNASTSGLETGPTSTRSTRTETARSPGRRWKLPPPQLLPRIGPSEQYSDHSRTPSNLEWEKVKVIAITIAIVGAIWNVEIATANIYGGVAAQATNGQDGKYHRLGHIRGAQARGGKILGGWRVMTAANRKHELSQHLKEKSTWK